MDRSQLFLYAVLIAGFVLFNFLMQWLARRAKRLQQQQQLPAPPQQEAPEARSDGLEDVWGRLPGTASQTAPARSEGTPRPERKPVVPPRPAPVAPLGGLLRTRRDLRHAIVLMTVLGPCRALEPHEGPEAGRRPR